LLLFTGYITTIKDISFNTYPIKYFRAKQLILSPGEGSGNLYILESGFVKVYRITGTGLEIVFTILKSEAFIPLLVALGDTKNDFYFEALTDCRVRVVEFEQFNKMVRANRQMHDFLKEKMIKGYGNLVERLEMLNTCDALTRVATAIVYLNSLFGQEVDGRISFPVKFSHELISGLAFTTRETASRKIEELNTKKIITTGYNNMQILNLDALKRIAN